jgi:hypothetical protein
MWYPLSGEEHQPYGRVLGNQFLKIGVSELSDVLERECSCKEDEDAGETPSHDTHNIYILKMGISTQPTTASRNALQ